MTELHNPRAAKAPLEDLMAAMDVVDTLRHQQGIAERELDGDARRDRLLKRLKDMYQAQGIEVPEHVLLEGIDALEQERFSYQPVAASWRTKVALIWVRRARWGKPIGFLAVIGVILWSIYFALEILPNWGVDGKIQDAIRLVQQQAKGNDAIAQLQRLKADAERDLELDDGDAARQTLAAIELLGNDIAAEYTIRVVSSPRQKSGVWRNPPRSNVRNYYLIVEAVDRNNRPVEVSVLNEENNKESRQSTWGLRVSQQLFNQIAADKKDDGIIQNNRVGQKRAGYLRPEYSVPTSGASITEW